MTLPPPDGSGPHEGHVQLSGVRAYDLIKLSKFWEGGEGFERSKSSGKQIENSVHFRPQDEGYYSLFDLVNNSLRQFSVGPQDLRLGTIQIVTRDEHGQELGDWAWLWRSVRFLQQSGIAEIPEVTKHLSNDVFLRLRALAGILQGLLDFRNIDASELGDVFKNADVSEDELIGFHKGTLLQVTTSDRAYDVAADSVGMSPYLLIPHSVLLHNEELPRRAMDAALRAETRNSRALESARRTISEAIDRHYLPNVFHYHTERMLYAVGETTRGLIDLRQDLHDRLAEIRSELEARAESRRRLELRSKGVENSAAYPFRKLRNTTPP